MNLLTTILDLVLPESCVGCGRPSVLLCPVCALPLQAPAGRAPALQGVPRPHTVALYEGPVKAVLSAYKEQGRTRLAVPLGEALATAIRAALHSHDHPTPRTDPTHDRDAHVQPSPPLTTAPAPHARTTSRNTRRARKPPPAPTPNTSTTPRPDARRARSPPRRTHAPT
ncbi:hypothetical protein AB0L25_34575 [Spirillospora sp. NPDC052242]